MVKVITPDRTEDELFPIFSKIVDDLGFICLYSVRGTYEIWTEQHIGVRKPKPEVESKPQTWIDRLFGFVDYANNFGYEKLYEEIICEYNSKGINGKLYLNFFPFKGERDRVTKLAKDIESKSDKIKITVYCN